MPDTTQKLPKLISVMVGVGISVGVVLITLYAPMRCYEAAVYLLAMSAPLSIFLLVWVVKKLRPLLVDKGSVWALYLLIISSVVMGVVGVLFSANVVFDDSPATSETYVVTGKHAWSSRGSIHYIVHIKSPVPSPLPFSIRDWEKISGFNKSEYERVVFNQTEVELKMHKGFFGLPWFEHVAVLHALADAPVGNR